MEIRTEQRNELPLAIEEIGLGKWHVRWNIREINVAGEDESQQESSHYEYNEVTLDCEPTQEEFNQITGK